MKKPFWKTTVGRIILAVLPMVLKKAKFNKTEKDSKNIDEVIDILKQND
jgi:hypothetical protein